MKTLRDPKRKPTHPGEVLREDVLPGLNMTRAEFARRLRRKSAVGLGIAAGEAGSSAGHGDSGGPPDEHDAPGLIKAFDARGTAAAGARP